MLTKNKLYLYLCLHLLASTQAYAMDRDDDSKKSVVKLLDLHDLDIDTIRKGANNGDIDCMNHLAWRHQNGVRGAEQDHNQKMHWWKKSAELGNYAGQYNLGYVYRRGEGCTPDQAEAIFWYGKSAWNARLIKDHVYKDCTDGLNLCTASINKDKYMLKVKIKDFDYGNNSLNMASGHAKPIIIATQTFINDGSAEIKQTFIQDRIETDRFSWNFNKSASLEFSNKCIVDVDAGVNFFGLFSMGGSATTITEQKTSSHFQQNQNVERTETKKHQIKQEITIQPHKRVEVCSIINCVKDYTIPFICSIEIRGFVTNNHGIIRTISSEALKIFLQKEGYRGQIVNSDEDAVYAQGFGTLTADVGLDTMVKTRDLPQEVSSDTDKED